MGGGGGCCSAVFFIVYGSCCSPVACSALLLSSHRMEIAPGLGNTKTKTLNLLKEFMGQTIASIAVLQLLWEDFYIFTLNFGQFTRPELAVV